MSLLRRFHFPTLLLFCLIAAAAASLAGADRATAADTIRIGGTGAALGDMSRLADAYMQTHPDTKIVVLPRSLGGDGGIKALRAGAIDIALVIEPLSPDEGSPGLTASPYAKSALAFATRLDTPFDSVTTDWVVDVYRGAVTHWPDGKPIRLVLRPSHDSDMKILYAHSDAMKQAMQAALARSGLLIADTAQAAARKLEQLEGSLGSTTLAQVQSEQTPLKLLTFDGVAPTAEMVAAGRYPLVKFFYHVTRPDASAVVRDFVSFLGSDEAAAILQKTGNVRIANAPRG
ncbi:substrate-binding domain-containing protein [Bradyrhizobium sediminis]|uniref:Substrate-binding domain-containing protein n=1 Tax=Bradyrhizobium sediminis TaxID=2840469 RepID=A0A975RUV9_9BRAD|nr:substrate-binding domain-containing protein [Bradyrhizobium sediminis]QWG21090.1 substrate-binding domain-containing protein [Bradyrhizobium sediminis]